MAKKVLVSKDEYICLVGLLTLASYHQHQIRDIERSMASLLEVQGDEFGYYGHVSDSLYEDYDAMELLKKLGISIDMPHGKPSDPE
jgi:hypothetical protein